MNRRIIHIVGLLTLLLLIAGAALSLGTRPQASIEVPTARSAPPLLLPTAPPTALPPSLAPDGSPAPIIVQRTPARGAELRPDGVVELVFDRPMDRASVKGAFSLAPAPAGAIEWADTRTLRFRPTLALPRASHYEVTLGAQARAQDGTPLNEAYQFRFATTGFLEVGQVSPAPDAQDVKADAPITVQFSHPVVPLTAVQQQSDLPQPLTFEPPISGRGEWLSTAIYVFHPAAPLAGGTTYSGHIAELADLDGNPLQAEYSWRFTVAVPQVVFVTPQDGTPLVSVRSQIWLSFNQPIDPASARTAFHLRSDSGADLSGALQVLNNTLVFTPAQQLDFDREYRLVLSAGLQGNGGGAGMAQDFTSSFRTVPLPRILKTTPVDGDQHVNADPYAFLLTIEFNAPIEPSSVMRNIQITPPISATAIYTGYLDSSHMFQIQFEAEPASAYRVQIGPGIADPYGNTIGQTQTIRFHTEHLPPIMSLISANGVVTADVHAPARVGLVSRNVPSATLSLYRLEPDDLTHMSSDWISRTAALAPLRRWQSRLNAPTDKVALSRIDLLPGGDSLDPGVYLLLLDQPNGYPQSCLVAVSAVNLTLKTSERGALVWANVRDDGQPMPNLALELFDEQDGTPLGTATTDADGVATIPLKRTENRGILALAREPFAATASQWSGGMSAGELGLPAAWDLPELVAYTYTDRPLYRPGQTVDYKGILRAEDDVRFSLPTGLSTVQVTIRSAINEQLDQQSLTLSPSGTFNGSLKLPNNAALGTYRIEVLAGQQGFGTSFQVAAYRPPEFQVVVEPQAREIVRGAASSATTEVAYFSSGPVRDAPVQWSIHAQPYHFSPDWAGRYTFGESSDPWRCWECLAQPLEPPKPILSGRSATDAQGRLVIPIPATLTDTEGAPITTSVALTIEATATGKNNQFVSGRAHMVVHSGQLYIGMAPQTYLGQIGQEQKVDLVTVDLQTQRLPNQTLNVTIFRSSWDKTFVQQRDSMGAWQWREQRTAVSRQAITTDSRAEATLAFTPEQAGTYRIVASAQDAGGNTVSSSVFVWVADQQFVAWHQEDNARITLIADRTEYRAGETARILIPAPFTGPQWALITVERGGVLSHEVRRLSGGSTIYQLPITTTHAPNVYVSVVLYGPPAAPGQSAEYKVGSVPIAVAPEPQLLRVVLTPQPAQAEPGQSIRYDLQVFDLAGRPVAAELSLDLVDKAVLSLLPRTPDAARAAFYSRRGLGVGTANSLTIGADRLFEQLEQRLAPLGGKLPPAIPASGPYVPDPEPLPVNVREHFADTAYWSASVLTDASGHASVQVTLPDNVTTWVMRGVAITDDTRVGEGSVELLATKPLIVRPVTPRFFVAGDTVELAANITNATTAALSVQVGLAARGLTNTGELTKTVVVPATGEAAATWQVVVQDVASADLVFTALAGPYSDASRPRLATGPAGTVPVYRYSTPDEVGSSGQLDAAGSRTEVVALPPNVDQDRGELTVRLEPSLSAGMASGLGYLEHYPYESTEQTVSRFLPNVLTARALQRLSIADAQLAKRLPGLVTTGLNTLYGQQLPDGGWSWWPGGASSPHISAYVIFGMLHAKEAGFVPREDALTRGLDYLSGALVAGADLRDTPSANRQAWLLYVLAEAGRPDTARLGELYDRRDMLDTYARAYLLLALQQAGATHSDPRIATLLSDLQSAAILSASGAHWEEQRRDYWSMNTDTRSTAIVLAALVRLDPQNQLNPNIVRWLMVARRDGIWETTQETAWALIALADWMDETRELQASYDYAAWLNADEWASGQARPATARTPVVLTAAVTRLLKDAGNRLTISRGAGAGRLYYTVHLRLFPPAEQIKALDRGVIVQRRYTLASCQAGPQCPEITQARLGDVIRVELVIVAPHDLYYLRVEDPLPAGAEAIDPALATTSQLTQRPPTNSGWWGWYTHSELRDEKLVLFADRLAKGSYLYRYTVQATLPGEFHILPATAAETYFPEVYGRSDSQSLRVTR